MNQNFFDYINDDSCILEKEPLEKVAKSNQLVAYLHEGFWHCIDTKRDKDNLEELIKSGRKNMVRNSKILVAGGSLDFIGANLISELDVDSG